MTTRTLTKGQIGILAAAAIPMVATGAAGAYGTYTNIKAEFGRAETALGIVAAGEGLALVLALVMVGLTMLGQPSPAPVRIGLWAVPIAASAVGLALADTLTEAVIYGMSPMGMCVSAEGLGLLARRIVVHRTGVDMEAQRRNAATMQRLAYHRARAAKHPSKRVRWYSERISWRLARKVGVGDAELGVHLVQAQRNRMSAGADAALAGMLTAPAADAFDVVAAEAVAVAGPQPDAAPAVPAAPALPPAQPASEPSAAASAAGHGPDAVRELHDADADAQLLEAALRLNETALAETGRVVPLRTLQSELRIGQRRAQRIQAQLPKSA
ncbi:conjugal transfer protein [Streptomyces nanhaiensis]|uniref:conjugal transfer protein n=1 Tax=Streptomyces nanhaiensis TaxID=679319 RepID=UPI00399C53AC